MQKRELPELSTRLSGLADALGGKAPSPAGLLVWGDALEECSLPDVLSVLTDWPKANSKMPTPNQVLDVCRKRMSTRIEEQAKTDAVTAPTVNQVLAAPVATDTARDALAAIRAILRSPRPHPRAWARKLKAKEEAGEPLLSIQRRMWREALSEREEAA